MYLAIIVLPLLGSIASGFFGRKVGVSGAQLITSLCIIITTLVAITIFSEVGLNSVPVSVLAFKWVDSESLNVLWGFNFDSLAVSMLIPVLIVSSLVHIYSVGYMSHDPHNQRFFSYLSLFTFMMVILVTANNFLLMFVGWEGVGVCSYLLVSFWFTRIAANQSSMSAFLTNRVGDCFLTVGMFAMLWTFGNLDYTTVFSLAPYVNENIITIVGVCLLVGAMAKSSQIGLHIWLPLAMEGPTPVSALIHAATMVTAGVYLLMRASPLIEYSSTVLIICLWVGSITTVFSSLIGLFQQDIKKVIAYSTMSQLGMMIIAVGLSSYSVALFHLVNHAFYKGLLFLGAGAVIHAVADNQDFRKYGGLLIFLPLTYTVMLIASLSLVAFPFMTGFYSKDFILESAFGQFKYSSVAVYFTATVGAMFTTLYSVKVLYLTFLTGANGPITNYNKAHEGDIFMSLPLIILALFSIFFGYVTRDMFIGLASGFFADNSLFIHPLHEIVLNTEFAIPVIFKLLPIILTVSLTTLSLVLFEFFPISIIYLKFTRLGYNIFSFLNLRFLVEYIYNRFITYFILNLGGQTTKILDKGSIEMLGPFGLERGLISLSHNVSKLDTAVVTSYALYILTASMLYILIPYVFIKDVSILLLLFYSLYMFNASLIQNISGIGMVSGVQKNYHVSKSGLLETLYQLFMLALLGGISYDAARVVYGDPHIATTVCQKIKQIPNDNIFDKTCYSMWDKFLNQISYKGSEGSNIAEVERVVHNTVNPYSLDNTSCNLWCFIRDGLSNVNIDIDNSTVQTCITGGVVCTAFACCLVFKLYNILHPAMEEPRFFSFPANVNDPHTGFLGTIYSYRHKYSMEQPGIWCVDDYHTWFPWNTATFFGWFDPDWGGSCLSFTFFKRFYPSDGLTFRSFNLNCVNGGVDVIDWHFQYNGSFIYAINEYIANRLADTFNQLVLDWVIPIVNQLNFDWPWG